MFKTRDQTLTIYRVDKYIEIYWTHWKGFIHVSAERHAVMMKTAAKRPQRQLTCWQQLTSQYFSHNALAVRCLACLQWIEKDNFIFTLWLGRCFELELICFLSEFLSWIPVWRTGNLMIQTFHAEMISEDEQKSCFCFLDSSLSKSSANFMEQLRWLFGEKNILATDLILTVMHTHTGVVNNWLIRPLSDVN